MSHRSSCESKQGNLSIQLLPRQGDRVKDVLEPGVGAGQDQTLQVLRNLERFGELRALEDDASINLRLNQLEQLIEG